MVHGFVALFGDILRQRGGAVIPFSLCLSSVLARGNLIPPRSVPALILMPKGGEAIPPQIFHKYHTPQDFIPHKHSFSKHLKFF